MTNSPCDFMDDINRSLDIQIDTECVQTVANAALKEINRLQLLDDPHELAEANDGGASITPTCRRTGDSRSRTTTPASAIGNGCARRSERT